MALSRAYVERWLVNQCRWHMDEQRANYSTVTDGTNPDLNDPISDGLLRHGILPADLEDVSTSDMATIAGPFILRFLVGCKIALKRRILEVYRSKADQEGVMQSRIEFQKRADGLAKDIDRDEEDYERATILGFSGGAYGGESVPGSNVPDAALRPFVPWCP